MVDEFLKTPLIEKLNKEKEVALDFQKRRHNHWQENYAFYRDHVETNRLTQRQAVNFPIMKETIKTLLSKIDDPPSISFKCLEAKKSGLEKEIILNELWDYYFNKLNFEELDILDKKNILLTGRSFKKLNFINQDFETEVLNNYDILIDPKVNPLDIETARWIIHQHIFKSLREILADPKYTKEGKEELKKYLDSQEGIIISQKAKETMEERQKVLKALGVENFDQLGASDLMVELKEHYTYVWDQTQKKFVRTLVIWAADQVELFQKPLKDVIGVEFYPFVTWGDDVDISDFWSDGIADLVRVPNKLLNIWLSQLLENRTLRNYGMTWYDATNPVFAPQTYEPKPFGQYPCPGDPNKIIKTIEIPSIAGTVEEIIFIRSIIERATAATAIEKGVSEKRQITLGEVELLAGKSTERIVSMAKTYRKVWKQFAEKWLAILEANVSATKLIKLYKESYTGKVYEKEIKASDWKSKAGYKVKVLSTSEQETEKVTALQKWIALRNQFPNNLSLQKIAQRRILENMGLTPDELKEVMDFEEQKLKAVASPVLPAATVSAPPEGLSFEEGLSKLSLRAKAPQIL